MAPKLTENHQLLVCIVIPREKRGIEELHDEEFLTRKAGEENEELLSLKSTKIL